MRWIAGIVTLLSWGCLVIAAPARTTPRNYLTTSRKQVSTTTLAPSPTPPGPFTALNFMQRFGYLPADTHETGALFNPQSQSVKDAIKKVQMFGAIPQTGELDNKTLELMVSPRCGVADLDIPENPQPAFGSFNRSRRTKRFVKGAEGWRKRTITYFIANWTPKIGQLEVETEMQKAFQIWSDYSRLKFVRVNDPSADIIVAFGRGPHGDGYSFDGPGNILAHAFYPYEMSSFGGDIHFDDDEKWKLKLDGPFDDGVDFLSVAVHELGHSMGLAHSPEPNSVMFPYFKGYDPNPPQLGHDDILAMYHMYIVRPLLDDEPLQVPTPEPQPPRHVPGKREEEEEEDDDDEEEEHSDENLDSQESAGTPTKDVDEDKVDCDDGNISPTRLPPTFHGDYETVDQHRSKFGSSSAPYSTPRYEVTKESEKVMKPTIETELPASDPCTGNYDAVALLRGELFVFKGKMVWRLTTQSTVVSGYPVPIPQMFHNLPATVQSVDAVYERPIDGNIVIFIGDQYWVTDGNRLLGGGPRSLSSLGLPSDVKKIDAIMVWGKNGKTYIFSGEKYWRYDEYAQQMEPGYPILTSERWRGIPTPLDSALTFTDGMTYFFKGGNFWRFDNSQIKADEHYPLPAPQLWLGCPEIPEDGYDTVN